MSSNDGGPAFPVPNSASVNGDFGMSKRDWFAGKALSGILATSRVNPMSWSRHKGSEAATLAAQCYAIADAMLEESKNPPTIAPPES